MTLTFDKSQHRRYGASKEGLVDTGHLRMVYLPRVFCQNAQQKPIASTLALGTRYHGVPSLPSCRVSTDYSKAAGTCLLICRVAGSDSSSRIVVCQNGVRTDFHPDPLVSASPSPGLLLVDYLLGNGSGESHRDRIGSPGSQAYRRMAFPPCPHSDVLEPARSGVVVCRLSYGHSTAPG
jgi:hypothetical protein